MSGIACVTGPWPRSVSCVCAWTRFRHWKVEFFPLRRLGLRTRASPGLGSRAVTCVTLGFGLCRPGQSCPPPSSLGHLDDPAQLPCPWARALPAQRGRGSSPWQPNVVAQGTGDARDASSSPASPAGNACHPRSGPTAQPRCHGCARPGPAQPPSPGEAKCESTHRLRKSPRGNSPSKLTSRT